ncbi:40S ribosomal protein S30 [Allomyces macrogynus ATCC 38327]|uniref:40S ribosomal protein S30 n=1 Tax=Allomyces macrogynus (strain ATCC 38327) TaxID=578462 RepID=A0A0L0SJA7_ALLM3|nr:40S ribosomal protein S30 [Allomyces macrogynus ATCC 38327]|eukprot:KNE62514.1 40S ribosomal protein S30 [Allomyces macrogynus ATCC 38327]
MDQPPPPPAPRRVPVPRTNDARILKFGRGNGSLTAIASSASSIYRSADRKLTPESPIAGNRVKSQTPKVDKQEKKKKKTGRAKKRLLYTRRFVNAVATFGGKRKMNPAPTEKP